jgi:SHS2 domain-containing protein
MPTDDELDDLLDNVRSAVVVSSPSGAEIKLLTDSEKDYYEQISARYQKDNIFANVSDLQELDRILLMELMIYRWSQWLLEEKDYDGELVNVAELQKNIIEHSKEIRLVKKALALDKVTREKEHGETVADYLHNLRLRAAEFGVMRNEQSVKAITLFKEIQARFTFYKNCTPDERTEFNATADDFFEWLESKFEEFDEIDQAFRETSQRYWIREI